jgi:hypothetical protein
VWSLRVPPHKFQINLIFNFLTLGQWVVCVCVRYCSSGVGHGLCELFTYVGRQRVFGVLDVLDQCA